MSLRAVANSPNGLPLKAHCSCTTGFSCSIVQRIKCNYCLDCGWCASIEDHDRQELAARAIEHATERDHDIDSEVVEVDE